MVRYAKRMEQLTNSDIGDLLKLIARPDIISFAGGLPAAELFPVDQLRQAVRRCHGGNGESSLPVFFYRRLPCTAGKNR